MEQEVKVTKTMINKVLNGEGSKSGKMKELFDLGIEVKEIAAALDVRYNFVYNVISNYCNMNGIQISRTEKAGKKEHIIELFNQGKSNKEISIHLKTNYNYVFNVLKAYKASLAVEESTGE